MQQSLLPPRLFQICLVVMVGFDVVFSPRPIFAGGVMLFAGIALALAGAFLTISGAGQFSRRKTSINTFLKPDRLVTDGLFALSRNPMYLGFALALAGSALVLNSYVGLAIAAGFVLVADRWYIAFEEPVMAETFGAAYADYCKKTRRWI